MKLLLALLGLFVSALAAPTSINVASFNDTAFGETSPSSTFLEYGFLDLASLDDEFNSLSTDSLVISSSDTPPPESMTGHCWIHLALDEYCEETPKRPGHWTMYTAVTIPFINNADNVNITNLSWPVGRGRQIINTDQRSNPPIRGMAKKLTYKWDPRGEGLMIFNFGGFEWTEKDALTTEAKGACGYAITEYDRVCNSKKKLRVSARSWEFVIRSNIVNRLMVWSATSAVKSSRKSSMETIQ
jgi:hypothetical protein